MNGGDKRCHVKLFYLLQRVWMGLLPKKMMTYNGFLKENLIDEYMITITPTIIGAGIPLLKEKNPEIALTLFETKRFGQFVQLHYRVKR